MRRQRWIAAMPKDMPSEGTVHVVLAGKESTGARQELSATVTKAAYCEAMEILIKAQVKRMQGVRP